MSFNTRAWLITCCSIYPGGPCRFTICHIADWLPHISCTSGPRWLLEMCKQLRDNKQKRQKEVQHANLHERACENISVFYCLSFFFSPPPPFQLKNKSGLLIFNVMVQAMIKTRACILFPPPFTAIPHWEYQQHQLARLIICAEECVHVQYVCVCIITGMAFLAEKSPWRKCTLYWRDP